MALSQQDANIHVTIVLSYLIQVSNATFEHVCVISTPQNEDIPVAATWVLPRFVKLWCTSYLAKEEDKGKQ